MRIYAPLVFALTAALLAAPHAEAGLLSALGRGLLKVADDAAEISGKALARTEEKAARTVKSRTAQDAEHRVLRSPLTRVGEEIGEGVVETQLESEGATLEPDAYSSASSWRVGLFVGTVVMVVIMVIRWSGRSSGAARRRVRTPQTAGLAGGEKRTSMTSLSSTPSPDLA